MLSFQFINVTPDALPFSVNYNQFNTGGAATAWSLTYNPSFEQVPPPEWLSIDPITGVLSVNTPAGGLGQFGEFWEGFVRAANESGFVEQSITVQIIVPNGEF